MTRFVPVLMVLLGVAVLIPVTPNSIRFHNSYIGLLFKPAQYKKLSPETLIARTMDREFIVTIKRDLLEHELGVQGIEFQKRGSSYIGYDKLQEANEFVDVKTGKIFLFELPADGLWIAGKEASASELFDFASTISWYGPYSAWFLILLGLIMQTCFFLRKRENRSVPQESSLSK